MQCSRYDSPDSVQGVKGKYDTLRFCCRYGPVSGSAAEAIWSEASELTKGPSSKEQRVEKGSVGNNGRPRPRDCDGAKGRVLTSQTRWGCHLKVVWCL